MKKIFSLLAFFVVITMQSSFAQGIPKWKLADLEQYIKTADKPTIINFWATFCKPCLEEMPYFVKVHNKYKEAGVNLVLVNLDMSDAYPNKIRAFATKRKINAPIAFLDETDADLFCPVVDTTWSGAIPATLFIDNKSGYRKFYEDQLTEQQLEKEVKSMIEKAKK